MIKISTVTPTYRGERYLGAFLESVRRQTTLPDLEVVLVQNEPSRDEVDLAASFAREHPEHIRSIVVDTVEPISASMNRAVEEARGEYVAIWNVDDLRTPDSLERQALVLDRSPEAVATYGDYEIVGEIGSTSGYPIVTPASFDRERFTRGMYLGCFPMWRRSIHARAGLFDEQFRHAADYELMVRLARHGPMQKAAGHLGYYLDEGRGLTTRGSTLLNVEQAVIALRYGMYEKLDYRYYRRAVDFRIRDAHFRGSWHPMSALVPGYEELLRARRRRIWRGLARYAIWLPYQFTQLARLRGRLIRSASQRKQRPFGSGSPGAPR